MLSKEDLSASILSAARQQSDEAGEALPWQSRRGAELRRSSCVDQQLRPALSLLWGVSLPREEGRVPRAAWADGGGMLSQERGVIDGRLRLSSFGRCISCRAVGSPHGRGLVPANLQLNMPWWLPSLWCFFFFLCSGQDLQLTMYLVKQGRREPVPNMDSLYVSFYFAISFRM